MASIYKRGKSYYLHWRENGKLFRKSLGGITKRAAETIRKAKELELLTGEKTLSLRTSTLVSDVLDEYLDWHEGQTSPTSHERTLSVWEHHLFEPFCNTPLEALDNRIIETHLIARKKQGAKQGTLEKEFNTLRSLVTWCVERDILSRKPWKGRIAIPKDAVSRPKRVYTRQELEAIYAASPNHWWEWKFVVNTGLRLGETVNLKRSDVRDGVVWVLSEENARTKAGKWRRIRLSPGAAEAYIELKRRARGDYLFPRVHRQSRARAFDTCLKRSGIREPRGSFHSLRHTFITQLIMLGKPPSAVQKLAGHSRLSTTEGYITLIDSYMDETTEDLDL